MDENFLDKSAEIYINISNGILQEIVQDRCSELYGSNWEQQVFRYMEDYVNDRENNPNELLQYRGIVIKIQKRGCEFRCGDLDITASAALLLDANIDKPLIHNKDEEIAIKITRSMRNAFQHDSSSNKSERDKARQDLYEQSRKSIQALLKAFPTVISPESQKFAENYCQGISDDRQSEETKIQKAQRLLCEGDGKDGFNLLIDLAGKEHSSDAMLQLSELYRTEGVPFLRKIAAGQKIYNKLKENLKQAIFWMKRAMSAGAQNAHTLLDFMSETMHLLEQAEEGDLDAVLKLCDCHREGIFLPKREIYLAERYAQARDLGWEGYRQAMLDRFEEGYIFPAEELGKLGELQVLRLRGQELLKKGDQPTMLDGVLRVLVQQRDGFGYLLQAKREEQKNISKLETDAEKYYRYLLNGDYAAPRKQSYEEQAAYHWARLCLQQKAANKYYLEAIRIITQMNRTERFKKLYQQILQEFDELFIGEPAGKAFIPWLKQLPPNEANVFLKEYFHIWQEILPNRHLEACAVTLRKKIGSETSELALKNLAEGKPPLPSWQYLMTCGSEKQKASCLSFLEERCKQLEKEWKERQYEEFTDVIRIGPAANQLMRRLDQLTNKEKLASIEEYLRVLHSWQTAEQIKENLTDCAAALQKHICLEESELVLQYLDEGLWLPEWQYFMICGAKQVFWTIWPSWKYLKTYGTEEQIGACQTCLKERRRQIFLNILQGGLQADEFRKRLNRSFQQEIFPDYMARIFPNHRKEILPEYMVEKTAKDRSKKSLKCYLQTWQARQTEEENTDSLNICVAAILNMIRSIKRESELKEFINSLPLLPSWQYLMTYGTEDQKASCRSCLERRPKELEDLRIAEGKRREQEMRQRERAKRKEDIKFVLRTLRIPACVLLATVIVIAAYYNITFYSATKAETEGDLTTAYLHFERIADGWLDWNGKAEEQRVNVLQKIRAQEWDSCYQYDKDELNTEYQSILYLSDSGNTYKIFLRTDGTIGYPDYSCKFLNSTHEWEKIKEIAGTVDYLAGLDENGKVYDAQIWSAKAYGREYSGVIDGVALESGAVEIAASGSVVAAKMTNGQWIPLCCNDDKIDWTQVKALIPCDNSSVNCVLRTGDTSFLVQMYDSMTSTSIEVPSETGRVEAVCISGLGDYAYLFTENGEISIGWINEDHENAYMEEAYLKQCEPLPDYAPVQWEESSGNIFLRYDDNSVWVLPDDTDLPAYQIWENVVSILPGVEGIRADGSTVICTSNQVGVWTLDYYRDEVVNMNFSWALLRDGAEVGLTDDFKNIQPGSEYYPDVEERDYISLYERVNH